MARVPCKVVGEGMTQKEFKEYLSESFPQIPFFQSIAAELERAAKDRDTNERILRRKENA